MAAQVFDALNSVSNGMFGHPFQTALSLGLTRLTVITEDCEFGRPWGLSMQDLIGSLFILHDFRVKETRMVATFRVLLLCFVMWFGGSSLLAFLTNQSPGWIHTNGSVLSFLCGWSIMFLCPGDAFYRMFQSKWLQGPLLFWDAANMAHSIGTRGVDYVLESEAVTGQPHAWTFCLLAALVASAGGGLILEVAGAWPQSGQSLPTGTPYGLNRILVLSPLYYFVLRNPRATAYGLWILGKPLDRPTAVAVTTAIMYTTSILHLLLDIDVFAPIVYWPLHVFGLSANLQPSLARETPAALLMLSPTRLRSTPKKQPA